MGSCENERTKIPQKVQMMYQETMIMISAWGGSSLPTHLPRSAVRYPARWPSLGCFLLMTWLSSADNTAWKVKVDRTAWVVSSSNTSVILFSVFLTKFGPLRGWRCLKAGSIQHSTKHNFQKKAFRHCHFGSSGKVYFSKDFKITFYRSHSGNCCFKWKIYFFDLDISQIGTQQHVYIYAGKSNLTRSYFAYVIWLQGREWENKLLVASINKLIHYCIAVLAVTLLGVFKSCSMKSYCLGLTRWTNDLLGPVICSLMTL